jgi:hypothetical protein
MPGQSRVPYDRTDPMVDVPAPQPGGAAFEGAPGGGQAGAMPGAPPAAPQDMAALLGGLGGADASGGGALGALGGGLEGANSDQLTGADLGAMGGDVGSPEDIEVAQLEAALQDPNTPPEIMQAIQQQLALAARRRLAGLGQGQDQMMGGMGGLGA